MLVLGAVDGTGKAEGEARRRLDLEGEVAVVTDDVPMGIDAAAARAHIQLVMLVNDWSLRNLIPGELAKGFGFYQSKPATALSRRGGTE